MHLPILPFQLVTIHLKTDALRLHDMQRLNIISWFVTPLVLLHEIRKEIKGLLRRRDTRTVCYSKRVVGELWEFGTLGSKSTFLVGGLVVIRKIWEKR